MFFRVSHLVAFIRVTGLYRVQVSENYRFLPQRFKSSLGRTYINGLSKFFRVDLQLKSQLYVQKIPKKGFHFGVRMTVAYAE